MVYFGKLEEEIKSRLFYLAFVSSLIALVASLQYSLQLSRIEFLAVFALIGIVVLTIIMWSGFESNASGFKRLEACMKSGFERLEQLLRKSPTSNNEKKEESKRVAKTTGAGAFGGMLVGGLLGLIFGPLGTVIGGIVGAIIGDELERQSKKRRT